MIKMNVFSQVVDDMKHMNFFSLHKNHVMVDMNVFFQVVMVFNSE